MQQMWTESHIFRAGSTVIVLLCLVRECCSFQGTGAVHVSRFSARPISQLFQGQSARPRVPKLRMLWAEGNGAGGCDDPVSREVSPVDKKSSSVLRGSLLSAIRDTHERQVKAASGAGLLDALGMDGTVSNNLLEQIMHTTAKDKQAVNEVEHLLRVVNALTSCPTEGGCPWTAEQDAMGIINHAKGELDEIAEEIVLGDAAEQKALESELGDLLFNTLLLIKLCERDGLGGATLEGAAVSARKKLRRRAPFIFGEGTQPQTPEEANAIWRAAKKREKSAAGLMPTGNAPLEGPPRFIEGLGIYESEAAGGDAVDVGGNAS